MTDAEQRRAAKVFAANWKDKGYEKGETHSFWLSLLHDVLGVKNPTEFIVFEGQVQLGHTGFIDGWIPSNKVLIEQKSKSVDLHKAYKQSDGSELTPYQQAKRYSDELELSRKPRWIVVCNFQEFHVHDMEKPHSKPEIIQLADLPKEYYRLSFLTDTGNTHLKREMELSIKAGEIVGVLYDEILKHYHDPKAEFSLKSLNMLCVRLVFCLYAEDAGIFGRKNQFHDYLSQFEPRFLRQALIDLFKVLDTKPEERDRYLDSELAAFPYVNGGLFADENIEIPQLDENVKNLLLAKASDDFDWSEISPTIFGAVFESTLNPETRRSGGMHYTSIENIHKVIDPLFLDDLKSEFSEICELKVTGTRNKRLLAFQEKLAGLTFLDPACGSGNFLTETYLSLRRIENEILKIFYGNQMVMDLGDVIKVSIGQFYGIEINDFAVTVAKTALWIAESQMMKATEDIVHKNLDFLPLKSYANIVEGNALRMDWESVIPKDRLNYIMGNPPFVGHQWRNKAQVADMDVVFSDFGNYGKLDYVASWFKKSADLIVNSTIRCAFVATNSLVQGESVATIWKPFFEKLDIKIDFAWHTFRWDSEATQKAHVHCVIIGFSEKNVIIANKVIFTNENNKVLAKNINGYLLDAPNMFIQNRSKSLNSELPKMSKGSQPTDGGNLLLSSEEKDLFLQKEPITEKWIYRFMMGDDFINSRKRFCFWLVNASPAELKQCPMLLKRIENVKEMRLKSPTKSVQKDALTPTLFTQRRQPSAEYMVIPRVSSEKREYIPIGFLSPKIIAGDKLQFIETSSRLIFGVLISNVHMAWMRTVCGRLKSDYSYSPAVYNNFPWITVNAVQKEQIEKTAQAILDARALYPDCSLADLYDANTMPPELRKAHQANDRAVMKAYGFAPSMTEPEIVAELMKRYQEMTDEGKQV